MSEARFDGLCAAPGCHNPLPPRSGLGRPPIYCCPACRPTAKIHKHRIDVEVDHVPTGDGERPSGRVWSVALRRGTRLVVVATELGRPSADNLANQISDLLNDHSRAQGVAID
jgi:hypothetical protein